MKKLLMVSLLSAVTFCVGAATFSTNVTVAGTFLLHTNGGKSVYNIQIVAPANAPTIAEFFDQGTLVAPLYGTNTTNGAVVTFTTFPTNYVTSSIGSTGVTNYATNAGSWTLMTTNTGNTNALGSFGSLAAGTGESVSAAINAVLTRGLVMRSSTGVTVVVTYNTQ